MAPAKKAAKPPAKAAAKKPLPVPKATAKALAKTVSKPPTGATPPATAAKTSSKPPSAPAAPATEPGAPSPTPTRLERQAGRDTLAQIEIVKDGHFFIARTQTDAGGKEYRNTVFEDLLTEMVITLQEQLVDR